MHSKIVSNVEEVKARGGRVIALISEGDKEIERLADATFTIPTTHDLLSPILTSVPLQLLAYHVAVAPRLQRGSAQEPRQVGDGRVTAQSTERKAQRDTEQRDLLFALVRLCFALCAYVLSRYPTPVSVTSSVGREGSRSSL